MGRAKSNSTSATANRSSEAGISRKFHMNATTRRVKEIVRILQDGELDINPPYQRGDVWGEERQRNLIKSLTMGLPVGAIFLNDRGISSPFILIDGKQRITAVRKWIEGDLEVPADWFSNEDKDTDKQMINYTELNLRGQRSWDSSATLNVNQTNFKDDCVQQEKELFDLINFGGVEQGQSDFKQVGSTTDKLAKVKARLAVEVEDKAAAHGYDGDWADVNEAGYNRAMEEVNEIIDAELGSLSETELSNLEDSHREAYIKEQIAKALGDGDEVVIHDYKANPAYLHGNYYFSYDTDEFVLCRKNHGNDDEGNYIIDNGDKIYTHSDRYMARANSE